MATFKAIVKGKRKDGFYPVYIRVVHRRKLAYIPTDKFVRDSVLSRTGEIEDPYVLQYCSRHIIEYVERLNKVDTEHWSVGDVVNFLRKGEADISFSDYARLHIDRMAARGQIRNAGPTRWHSAIWNAMPARLRLCFRSSHRRLSTSGYAPWR